jgi:hypothetical protein
MSNNDLERYVSSELHWDPKIDDSAIAVSADDGVVTLRSHEVAEHARGSVLVVLPNEPPVS